MAGAFAETALGPEHATVPLRLMWCEPCKLMQTGEKVDPDVLFRNYSYRSSVSGPLVEHFADLADVITQLPHDLVVDVGCNDGVLIKPLRALGVNAIGVDPSDIALNASREGGWPLVNDYLTPQVAVEMIKEWGRASVVVASNVFAHVENIHSLCEAVRVLLAPDGTFICEVHYLGDLLEGCQFDTVYHEHVLYYSRQAMGRLAQTHGMYIHHYERIPTHAGSIRFYMKYMRAYYGPYYSEGEEFAPMTFARRALRARDIIRETVSGIAQKRQVWAYGAAGRSTILLNWCELGAGTVKCVIDASPRRIGRLVPGTRTPIYAPDRVEEGTCGAMLVTAWNYYDAIRAQHADPYMWWIKPLPELVIQ